MNMIVIMRSMLRDIFKGLSQILLVLNLTLGIISFDAEAHQFPKSDALKGNCEFIVAEGNLFLNKQTPYLEVKQEIPIVKEKVVNSTKRFVTNGFFTELACEEAKEFSLLKNLNQEVKTSQKNLLAEETSFYEKFVKNDKMYSENFQVNELYETKRFIAINNIEKAKKKLDDCQEQFSNQQVVVNQLYKNQLDKVEENTNYVHFLMNERKNLLNIASNCLSAGGRYGELNKLKIVKSQYELGFLTNINCLQLQQTKKDLSKLVNLKGDDLYMLRPAYGVYLETNYLSALSIPLPENDNGLNN